MHFSKTTWRLHHPAIARLTSYALIVHQWQWLTGMSPVLESSEEMAVVRRSTPAMGPSARGNEEAAYGTTTL